MDKVIELTYELKEELNSLPLFQEYKRIKHLVDTSNELKEMKEEIARTKDKSKKDSLTAVFFFEVGADGFEPPTPCL